MIFVLFTGNLLLKENASSRAGLMSALSLECSSCEQATSLQTSATITQRGRSFDVNRRAVYHSLETGSGYEGLASFCSIMNMPCISKVAYYKQLEVIMEAQEDEAQEEMNRAGQKLHQTVLEESDEQDSNAVVDVAVSFDGTWAKRGFSSLIGVVFVISVDTGEVLDCHVLSKACQQCALKKTKCGEDNKTFDDWKTQHIANGECDINFTGSSPAMEAEGAVIMWGRSIERHNIRYKWMVSDGDSKAFSSVEETYEGCKVEKLDCVGHVQKRMGKHLFNLKARTKGKLADGKSIGGKGRLTEIKIKQLQRYYGLAIRQNTITKVNPTDEEIDIAVYSMKKNIIAVLTHNVQSDSLAHQHQYCPTGETSWCKWQQDLVTGTTTYKGDNCLPRVFLEVLRPVFMTLSDSKLLTRCIRGTTQNPNECINSLVWVRCPKHKHHSAKVVRFAVASAVCHFHGGALSRERVMQRLAIPAGTHTREACNTKDKKRVRQSDLETSKKQKKRRQGEQLRHTRREEALREAEGTTYEAGGF